MIALIQRVSRASVEVNGKPVGQVGKGVLALIGVERDDNEKQADRLVEKILGYRIFPDGDDRMNLSVLQIQGDLLLVPQFTLAADTQKGMRPSFTSAAQPEEGRRMFDYLLTRARAAYSRVEAGQFGADMQVELLNDGPVTFWLQSR